MEGVGVMAETAWSLVPPIITIVLALVTKEVYMSLALGIFITVSSIVTVFTDPSYMNLLDQMYQQMYGVDMEEFWQSYL